MDALQTFVLDPLQPYLKPVTKALPEPVHSAIISLIGSPCHSALVLDLDVTKDPACTSLAISKGLGIGIVGSSAIVKVPQILKLVNSGSAAGVSFVSYALETASLLITLAYSVRQQFPFSTYGENALIAVQDVVVGLLVLTFGGKTAGAAVFVAVVAASIYALLFEPNLIDNQTLTYLQTGAGILGISSKLPQIYTIWKEGSTGQLSAFAVFNYLLGSLSRIFTTIQEVDDKIILYSFIAAFSLNAIIAAQMVYYWNESPAKTTQAKKPSKNIQAKPQGISTGASPSAGKTPTTRRRG